MLLSMPHGGKTGASWSDMHKTCPAPKTWHDNSGNANQSESGSIPIAIPIPIPMSLH